MVSSAMLVTSALAALAAAPALAQSADASAAAETTEEIIVTAQKREQALIDVPQSVSVVGGDTLERLQANNFQDYLKLVPGLQLTQDTPGVGRLILRGVNTGGVASTVAVYVDDTPFGSSSGLVNGAILAGDFDTFDVARVEVLRGPQGTLYGASSLGGVLKFVTTEPQTEAVDARARISGETVKDGDMSYNGTAMVNLPLGDRFAVRASGFYRDVGGFIDSIGTAGSDVEQDINDARIYGGRVSALLTASETFSIQATAILQNTESDAPTAVESDPNRLATRYGRLSLSQYVPAATDISYRLYNAKATLDLGAAELVSSTSYGKLDQDFRDDLTTQFSPLLAAALGVPNELYQDQTTAYDKVTQELRLASNPGMGFDWLIGGYYTREKGRIIQHFEAVTPGTLTPIAGLPPLADAALRSVYKEYAGFANATLYLGDRFDLTFGGRYSHNDQRASQQLAGVLVGTATYPVARSDENVFTYSVAPKFKFDDDTSLYGRVAKGFRPGGPNVLPPGAPAGTPLTYDSDSIVSYEVGLKTEMLGRALTLDVSAFHIDWDDIQLLAQINNVGLNTNGGTAESEGVEFTVTARPIDGLNLSVNGAYTNARLTAGTSPLVGGFDGDRLPYTPPYSLNVNADYDWDVGEAVAYVGASLRSLSKQTGAYDFAFRTANGRQRQLPAYEVIDLRAGFEVGRYAIEAFARNIGNAEGKTSVGGTGIYPLGSVATGIIRPRSFGLSLTVGL